MSKIRGKAKKVKNIAKKSKFFVGLLTNPFFWGAVVIFLAGLLLIGFLIAASDDDSDCSSSETTTSSSTNADQTKRAKDLFDYFVNQEGFSGAGAAGAVAVAKKESGIDPSKENTEGGVAGIMQWSGFSNNTNGSRIMSEGSIVPGDKSTLTWDNEIKLLHYELHKGYEDAAKTVGNASSASQAADDWSEKYEGLSADDEQQTKHSQIENDAEDFYKQFGGDSISANPSLISAKAAASSGSSSDSNSSDDSCSSSDDSSSSGSDGYVLPVKGTYSLGTGTYPSYTPNSTDHDHNGVDFQNQGLTDDAIKNGDEVSWVYAVHDGKVVAVNHNSDEYVVIIQQTDNKYAYYGHSMKEPVVSVGQKVKKGQHISFQGYGGDVRPKSAGAAHVHFGLSKKDSGFGPGDNDSILSPADYLPLPKEVLPDSGKSEAEKNKNDRVIGSGFTKFFLAAGTNTDE